MRKTNYPTRILATQSSWNIGDDWDTLSSDNPTNAMDGASIYNIDPVMEAAREMNYHAEISSDYVPNSTEDDLITEAVDTIYSQIQDPDAPTLYDTKEEFDQYTKTIGFSDEMGREISLLVRCNESPDDLLVSMGRKLPELKDDDKYDALQLLDQSKPTLFFTSAVQAMFHMHASLSAQGNDELVFTRNGIASWMSKSLGEKVGQHDKRITIVLSKYSTHGSGVLTMNQFEQLYMDAATLSAETESKRKTVNRPSSKKKHESPTMKSVWRDLENHGFQPPIMEERQLLQEEIEKEFGANRNTVNSGNKNFMDECEILEWKDDEHSTPRASSTSNMKGATTSTKKSSHESVTLASDGKTPSRLRDGDFVFIDEESCIGCTQCANVASFSFHMLDNGRARTFEQSNLSEVDTAISVCPVSCMHKVAFHELEEMETARDVLGSNHKNIPLNVARIDSDANRKSSWYHTLKHKCFTSKSCPQRGCFDCPHFDAPGANPYFQKLHATAEHVRATDLMKSGEADAFRNNSEL
jgi:ferredoxin